MIEEEPERQEATEGVEEGDKDDDEVVLKLDCIISDMSRSEKAMATEAIELVGRLLGLALRPTTSDAPQAADTNGGGPPKPGFRSGNNPNPAMEYTPFARAVLAFLAETALMATWDAEEGTFPVPSALYYNQKWEEEINGDGHKEEDTNKTAAHEIEVLCNMNLFVNF